jgi:glycosyltransferase involved in cell wall biosynthesis
MKACYIIDSLSVGGAERVAVDICNLMVQSGYSCRLIVIRNSGPLYSLLDGRVDVVVLNLRSKLSIFTLIRLSNLLRGFDFLHVHMRHSYGLLKAITLFSVNNSPIYFHDHYGDIAIDKSVPWYFSLFGFPSVYIGVSKDLTTWANDICGIPSDQVYFLPNTIIPNRSNLDSEISGDFIVISNFRPSKNLEFIIELANNYNLSVDFYGQVSDADYFKYLQSLVKVTSVRFFSEVPNAAQYIGGYKMALHSAISETGPLVLLEYLERGLPFISYKTGQVADTIYNECPYLFLNDFNLPNWKQAIDYVSSLPDMKFELKSLFNKYFHHDVYKSKLINIYSNSLNE